MARLDEVTLRRMYLDEGQTIQQIARVLHMRKQSICDALTRWAIPRRQRGPRNTVMLKPLLDEATLRRLYLDEDQTIREIARTLRVSPSAVRDALVHWGIPRRRPGPRRDLRPLPESTRLVLRSLVAVRGIRGAARTLKIAPEVVHAMLGSRPLPRGAKPRVDDPAVRAAYEAGTAVAAIARQWQCSERTVRRSLQRTCVRPPR
jgi:hypothetical protein